MLDIVDITGIIFACLIVIPIGIVLILLAIRRKKIKRMLADERLRNARIFKVFEPVAISPDGFIGNVNFPNIIIIHIKDIKSFQITFDKEQIERNTGDILFDNINVSVQPYLKKKIEYIELILNLNNNNVAKIPFLRNNSTKRKRAPRLILPIPESKQDEIKQLLSAFEEVEKHIKGA